MEYLDFEEPVKIAQEQLEKCLELNAESGVDIDESCQKLQDNLLKVKKEVYSNLTDWQKVQLSRHPGRPYTLDYIDHFSKGEVLDLHGDRYYGDDKAMVGRLGKIGRQTFMMIGQQKGKNTKQRQERRFGMSNPEGYRKALRLMKLAEKFNIPIVTLVDTPGAYPGIEAEERGQGEAIAKNIYEMLGLKVPVITVVIGEGASGGALGIGVGNTVLMMQYTWYSVISPESCSSILWRSWDYKEVAAEQLNLTADDMLRNKLIDGIIKEPLGGAQYDPEAAFKSVQAAIIKEYKILAELSPEELVTQRQNKFLNMGVYSG